MLHGECVAVGLICELSVAAALGHFPFHHLPTVIQLLDSYNLPSQPPLTLPLGQVAAALLKDKKNVPLSPGSSSCVSLVIMSDIGRPLARKSLPAPTWLVLSTMARSISVAPPCQPIVGEVRVPGSKSISNRALLLAALCPHPVQLNGILHCDDTRVMIEGAPSASNLQFVRIYTACGVIGYYCMLPSITTQYYTAIMQHQVSHVLQR
jgi:pentafunctional AROM polypeptide